jgi:hypothetical protein
MLAKIQQLGSSNGLAAATPTAQRLNSSKLGVEWRRGLVARIVQVAPFALARVAQAAQVVRISAAEVDVILNNILEQKQQLKENPDYRVWWLRDSNNLIARQLGSGSFVARIGPMVAAAPVAP